MKKILSALCALCAVGAISACSQTAEPAPMQTVEETYTVGPDTTVSIKPTPESSDSEPEIKSTEDENSIFSETTQGYSEITTLPPETQTEQPEQSEVISEAFTPAYDPGQPDVYLDISTREIYPETKQITFSVNSSVECEISGEFVLEANTDNGWEVKSTILADSSHIITPESPYVCSIYPGDFGITLESGDEYRISTKVNGKEYEVFFVVGAHIPSLKAEDIELYMPSAIVMGEADSFNIQYTYVGGVEHAEYGFGCEYTLEKRNENGQWEKVPFSENAAFISLGYLVSYDYPTNSTSVSLKDDFYAEPLTEGTYRVVKPMCDGVTLTGLFRLNDGYPREYPYPTDNDLSVTINEVENNIPITTDSEFITLDIKYIGDDDYAEFDYGTYEKLEKYVDGKWVTFEYADGIAWDAIAMLIGSQSGGKNGTYKISLNDRGFKEPVTAGKYRVIKEFSDREYVLEFEVTEAEFSGHDIGVDISVKGSDSFDVDDESKQLTLSYSYTTDDLHIYSDFRVQKRDENGKWQMVDFSETAGFDDYVIILNKDNPTATETLTLSDSMFKKPLETGTYRVIKDLCDCTSASAVFFIFQDGGIRKPSSDDIEMSVRSFNNGEEITTETEKLIVDYVYTGNDDYAYYEFYSRFTLQQKKNGKWVDLKPVQEDENAAYESALTPIGTVEAKNCTTVRLSQLTSEKITAGTYRLVQKLHGSCTKTAEFEITEAEAPYEIDSESGNLTLTINEIKEDGFVCSLPWPYPAVYTVQCSTDEYDDYCVGDNIEVEYAPMYKLDKWEYLVIPTSINMSDFELEEGVDYKPVIYLYPEEKTDVSVQLDYNGELTVTYPEYGDGWNVTAMPDGTLYDENGNEYSYLFWEGESEVSYDFSKGFCVKGEDTVEFLRNALSTLGLTPREYNEFIVFWLPFMQDNEYNVISFQSDCYTDNAVLSVTPDPDTVLRVFMAFYPSDTPVEIEEQELETTEREGFTVVEWGGTIVQQ